MLCWPAAPQDEALTFLEARLPAQLAQRCEDIEAKGGPAPPPEGMKLPAELAAEAVAAAAQQGRLGNSSRDGHLGRRSTRCGEVVAGKDGDDRQQQHRTWDQQPLAAACRPSTLRSMPGLLQGQLLTCCPPRRLQGEELDHRLLFNDPARLERRIRGTGQEPMQVGCADCSAAVLAPRAHQQPAACLRTTPTWCGGWGVRQCLDRGGCRFMSPGGRWC